MTEVETFATQTSWHAVWMSLLASFTEQKAKTSQISTTVWKAWYCSKPQFAGFHASHRRLINCIVSRHITANDFVILVHLDCAG